MPICRACRRPAEAIYHARCRPGAGQVSSGGHGGVAVAAPARSSSSTRLFERELPAQVPVFAVGVSFCPWLADRAANMGVIRPILQQRAVVYHEETDRAPNHVWSRRLWSWAASQPATHAVLVQDDVRLAEKFWPVVDAMVRAQPRSIISLIANHPLSYRALEQGRAWFRMCETLGTAYVMPIALLGAYLDWYTRLDPAFVASNCEDFLLSQWVCTSGRKTLCPVPTVVQTRDEIPTSHASNPTYPYRKSYIAWDDARVAGRDITAVDYWRAAEHEVLDLGHAVTNDTRYPKNTITNDEVLAAARAYAEGRTPVTPKAAAHPAKADLRVWPPRAAGLDEGLRHVLAGSYDIPGLSFVVPPRIVDCGANVGSFSVWAATRWPGATITAYEPSPDSAAYCRKNVEGIAQLVERAVVGQGGPAQIKLYEGASNTGQRSIYQLGEQKTEGVVVQTVRGHDLPPCDILKIDTEGCEIEILRDYLHLSGVRAVMLEWHRKEDYDLLRSWLPKLGFKLVRDDTGGKWLADRNLIFVRERVDRVVACPGSDLLMLGEQAGYMLEKLPDLAAPVILDIGAHVGTFALTALDRWRGSSVLAFEPHPETYDLLRRNTTGCRVEARNVAVVLDASAPLRLYEGVNGRHECSLRSDILWGPDASNPRPHCSQQLDNWVDAVPFAIEDLPPCDVLKVDCEGGEVDVLTHYRHLKHVKVLITEAHAVGGDVAGQAAKIRALAEAAGLKWLGPDRIVARFAR